MHVPCLRTFAALLATGALFGCAPKGVPYDPPTYRYAPNDRVPEWLALEGYHDGRDFSVSRAIAPGVEHTFTTRAEVPVTINTVTIDMGTEGLAIEAESGQDDLFKNETLPAMYARFAEKPVAMCNADFWAGNSAPVNLFVDEGVIWRGPWQGGEGRRRPVFAFDDLGNFFLGRPEFEAKLTGPEGQTLRIDGVTFPQEGGPVTAYTWKSGEIPAAGEDSHLLPLILPTGEWLPNEPVEAMNGLVVRMMPPPDRTVTLHSTSEFPAWALESKSLTLSATLEGLPGKVVGAVGGGPQLLVDGGRLTLESAAADGVSQSFVETWHPRTAIGIKADGRTLVMATVDGRQPGRAVGIDLFDLADLMREAGCVRAMNLDGGGSTTLMVRDEIANFPSDGGGPRSVSNALVVHHRSRPGAIASMELFPKNAIVAEGAILPLIVKGYGEHGEPVDVAGTRMAFAVEQGDARIDGGNLVVGEGSEPIVVRASAGAASDTESFVPAVPDRIAFVPDALTMESGDTARIRLAASLADGSPLTGHLPVETLEAPNFVAIRPHTHPIAGGGVLPAEIVAQSKGLGTIEATVLGRAVTLPVAVDTISGETAFGFEALPEEDIASWIRGLRHDPAATTVTLEAENRKEGDFAWRFDYGMAHGGTTKIELPIDARLAEEAIGVGLWVHGDGKGQWLRGELRDADGKGYYLNFTDSGGIDWNGEWKFIVVSVNDFVPMGGHAGGPVPPFTVKSVYVAQTQEAAKSTGTILLDGLTGIEVPGGGR